MRLSGEPITMSPKDRTEIRAEINRRVYKRSGRGAGSGVASETKGKEQDLEGLESLHKEWRRLKPGGKIHSGPDDPTGDQ